MDGHKHTQKKKKKKDVCMSVHEQKWMDQKKKKKKMVACPSMNKSGQTPKNFLKKKIEDEVTLSHIGKSTTQSRQTKYL